MTDTALHRRRSTRRHSFIATLLGIKHLVVAVNKMDLIEYDEAIFDAICQQYLDFAQFLPQALDIRFVSVSALTGENIVAASGRMAWYNGPSMLDILETIQVRWRAGQQPLRFPVQTVSHPNAGSFQRRSTGAKCDWPGTAQL